MQDLPEKTPRGSLPTSFAALNAAIRRIMPAEVTGTVASASGLELMGEGLGASARIGSQVLVSGRIRGEVVGLDDGCVRILPYGSWEGVAAGDPILLLGADTAIRPDISWRGHVFDAFGKPLDGAPGIEGGREFRVRADPPSAFGRRTVGAKLDTGIRAMDVFVPICRGQRMGIFAGSGVGKSTLMAMLTKSDADVIVMGLVGERGREVQDFIQNSLGPEGMARSVLVVATSNEPSLTRRQAAWTATAIAEFFRDLGLHVLLMIDSVTRFAMAQREIGLAAGEPPTTKGYTPTVFTELPRLLERSGPGDPKKGQGDITAIYTVLVDGDDHNEPIADTVRGILDGHIVLDRKIAEKGRFPAINVQKSVSRMLPHCHVPAEQRIMAAARRSMAVYAENEELIRVGAYRAGADAEIDLSIRLAEAGEKFLGQSIRERTPSATAFAQLYGLLAESGHQVDVEEG